MTSGQVIMVVVIVGMMDLIIVPAVIHAAISGYWAPIADKFPWTEPAAGSPRWNFASLKIGVLNLGWSVHLLADDAALHMTPVKVMRWFGMKGASIPWDEIEYLRDRGKRWSVVKIAGHEIMGPREPFQLAKEP